jgi:hypothetical protein
MLEGETQHGSSVKKCPRRVSEDEQDSSSISIKQKRVVEDKTQAIIEWSPSGRAFKIVDVAAFSSQILSKYFRTSNFSSFQRNLNLVSALMNALLSLVVFVRNSQSCQERRL